MNTSYNKEYLILRKEIRSYKNMTLALLKFDTAHNEIMSSIHVLLCINYCNKWLKKYI